MPVDKEKLLQLVQRIESLPEGSRNQLMEKAGYAVRDNTRVAVNPGYVGFFPNAVDRNPGREVRIDDGIMGFMPIVGDALQAGQAAIDASDGKWGRALLGAGLLVAPNILEKPGKAILHGLRNSAIRDSDNLYKAAEKAIKHAEKRNAFLGTEFSNFPEYGQFVRELNLDPNAQSSVDAFAKRQATSVRGVKVPTERSRTTDELRGLLSSLSEEERKRFDFPTIMGYLNQPHKISPETISSLEDVFLTSSPYSEKGMELAAKYGKSRGIDALGTNGIYSSNSLSVANDNAIDVLGKGSKGVIGEIESPLFYDKSAPIEEQLKQISSNVFSYDDIILGGLGGVYGMESVVSDAAEKAGYRLGDHNYAWYKRGKGPIYERTTLNPDDTAILLRKINSWYDPKKTSFGIRGHNHNVRDKGYFIPKVTTEPDLEKTADLLSWLTNSYGNPLFDNGGPLLLYPYAGGGKIHIKPSKRGTFTAAAKKHGKSVQAFASQVLAHKENYSPAMVKKANFARNAARWHAEGGQLDNTIDYTGIATTNNRKYNPDYISYIDTSLANADVSPAKRASILANIIEESGGNPFALDDTGKFYGLLQWADDRYKATGEKDPYKEIDNQVNHILNTLGNTTDKVSWTHGGTGSGYNSYKEAMADFDSNDLATAMRGFTLGYVRPTGKTDSYNNRLKVAEQLLQRYNSTPLQKVTNIADRINKVYGGDVDAILRLIGSAKGGIR